MEQKNQLDDSSAKENDFVDVMGQRSNLLDAMKKKHGVRYSLVKTKVASYWPLCLEPCQRRR